MDPPISMPALVLAVPDYSVCDAFLNGVVYLLSTAAPLSSKSDLVSPGLKLNPQYMWTLLLNGCWRPWVRKVCGMNA